MSAERVLSFANLIASAFLCLAGLVLFANPVPEYGLFIYTTVGVAALLLLPYNMYLTYNNWHDDPWALMSFLLCSISTGMYSGLVYGNRYGTQHDMVALFSWMPLLAAFGTVYMWYKRWSFELPELAIRL